MIGNYDHIALLAAGTAYPFNNVRGRSYYQAVLSSPNKTWETIETSNIGLDIAVLKNKLTFTADYFVKRNDDMLAPKQLSSIIGVATSAYNLASLKTWGWEISAGWRDNVGSFSYWINANIGDNQNKVLNYNGQTAISSGINGIIEGYPINTIFGYDAIGYFQTADEVSKYPKFSAAVGPGDIKYRDVNGDGKINTGLGRAADKGDLVELGNTNPRYTYGFDFGFSYKGFDFSACSRELVSVSCLLILPLCIPILPAGSCRWTTIRITGRLKGRMQNSPPLRWRCAKHGTLFTLVDEWRLPAPEECATGV